ncbi:MAG: hypothetical protein ACREON_10185 [Gemmatimonadaceae bacterium]
MIASLGLPADAVAVEEAGTVVALQTLSDRIRPALGGLEINRGVSPFTPTCTMGFIVYKKDEGGNPDPSLGRFFFTASHCSSERGVVNGNIWGQPNINNHAAVEVADPPLIPFNGGSCPHTTCQMADLVLTEATAHDDPNNPHFARRPAGVLRVDDLCGQSGSAKGRNREGAVHAGRDGARNADQHQCSASTVLGVPDSP